MRSYSLMLWLGIAVFADAFGASTELNPVRHHPRVDAVSAVQRIIVKLRANALVNFTESAGVKLLTQRNHLTLMISHQIIGRLHVIQAQNADAGESVTATLARLRADPAVEYAEIDQRRYLHALPNDPLFPGLSGQWYLQNNSATPSAIDAVTAWSTTTGSNAVVIADLDTGVRFDHPDLLTPGSGGRLLPGYDFITDILTANDGNGRDPDASDPGDWISTTDASTAQFSGCPVSDSSWHGTRVAGILGAITNNATGIAGLTWNNWVLPVRVLGKCGGYDSDIQEGMLWAAGVHVVGVPDNPNPAKIENMSLGSTGSCPQSYQDILSQLTALSVLVVASAGNEGGPVDAPANCSGVAAVAGLRHAGTKVGYSSLGPEVTVSAPAGNCVNTSGACLYPINTTYNTGTTIPTTNSYTDEYNTNLGTSFSAPMVSGIAALMLAVNGNLNPAQLIARLREGGTTFPVSSDTTVPTCHVPANASDIQNNECNCTTQTCGAGMANAGKAVAAALRPIAAIGVPATVVAGQNVVLQGAGSAAACQHSISAYSWTVVNGSAPAPGISGATSATATVTAPTSGSFTVRLTVTDDNGQQDTADVVVSATSATTTAPANAGSNVCLDVTVAVSPLSVTVQAGIGTQVFTAAAANTINAAMTWQVNNITGGNATVGTISTAGVYTAPMNVPSPAAVTVTAVSAADPSRSGSAQVTVTSPVAVSVSPASISVQAGGGSQPFAATVLNTANTAVTWQVNNLTGGNTTVGTISATGVYAAPASVPAPVIVTVTAMSDADPSRSGAAQVTITAPSATSTPPTPAPSGGGGAIDVLTLLAAVLVTATRSVKRRH